MTQSHVIASVLASRFGLTAYKRSEYLTLAGVRDEAHSYDSFDARRVVAFSKAARRYDDGPTTVKLRYTGAWSK